MDNPSIRPAHLRKRDFPGYTTAQLESSVASRTCSEELRLRLSAEIAARKAGLSVVFRMPTVA